jgi:small ligand-binding sensory domain FIST
MRFHAAVSDAELARDAAAAVVRETREAMRGKVDVVFLFLSAHHLDDADAILESVWLGLDPQAVVGCSAAGVIGVDRELDRGPGVSLLAGEIPGARFHPFHVTDWDDLLDDADDGGAELARRLGVGPQTRAIVGFGDPFSTPVSKLLPALDRAGRGAPLVGGMASSGRQPGRNRLFHNDRANDVGFAGVSVSGALSVETVVSQGCRPVGRPMVITKAHDNVIEQLGGRPALAVLKELVDEMPEADKELLAEGLFFGQAVSEYRERFGRGDFLVRNVIGIDDDAGTIGVAEYVRPGRTAQFHVRDADTASEDLSLLLESQRNHPAPPAGALLFSCNGRGSNLFETPCHDVAAARRAMPQTPVAGFFAAGEFGPVGGRNFLHGHTASFALFRPAK